MKDYTHKTCCKSKYTKFVENILTGLKYYSKCSEVQKYLTSLGSGNCDMQMLLITTICSSSSLCQENDSSVPPSLTHAEAPSSPRALRDCQQSPGRHDSPGPEREIEPASPYRDTDSRSWGWPGTAKSSCHQWYQ